MACDVLPVAMFALNMPGPSLCQQINLRQAAPKEVSGAQAVGGSVRNLLPSRLETVVSDNHVPPNALRDSRFYILDFDKTR